MSLNLQSFAVFIIIGSFCYLNHIFGLEKYKFAAFGSSLKCKQALLSCYITYAPVVTDKRTDVWSRPSCIYTQIFSPKKRLVFSRVSGIEYCVVECYCTCIIKILRYLFPPLCNRYFFILQSLTTSKMRQFQTIKLSQFHRAKYLQG